jgi:hypothetical protein
MEEWSYRLDFGEYRMRTGLPICMARTNNFLASGYICLHRKTLHFVGATASFISILACSRLCLPSYAEFTCVTCAFRNFLTSRQRILSCARPSLPLTVGGPELLQLARQLFLASPYLLAIRVQTLHQLESIVENRN